MPPVPWDAFVSIVTALVLAILWFVKREVTTHDKRIKALEEHVVSDKLAHQQLAHDIESNADRSDHQDTLLSVALGGKVSTATVRAAGVRIDSEPPSSPMLMRPRFRSRGGFGE